MKILAMFACCVALAAHAEGYVEAVFVEQVTGLEKSYPAYSPDESKLVFESTRDGPDADIFLMNTDGTNVVQLTDNGRRIHAGVYTGWEVHHLKKKSGTSSTILAQTDTRA